MDISKVDLQKLTQESGKKKIWIAQQLKTSPSTVSIAINNTRKGYAVTKLREKIYKLLTT